MIYDGMFLSFWPFGVSIARLGSFLLEVFYVCAEIVCYVMQACCHRTTCYQRIILIVDGLDLLCVHECQAKMLFQELADDLKVKVLSYFRDEYLLIELILDFQR